MVFQDKAVGDFVNERFVSLKVDAAKGWGKESRKEYKVLGFPTVVFLDAKGEEIDRIVGFNNKKDKYFSTLKDYANGKNTLVKYLAEIKADPDNIKLNFKLGKKYLARFEGKDAAPYFKKVLQLDPENKNGYNDESRCQVAMNEVWASKNIKPLLEVISSLKDQKLLQQCYSTLVRHYMRAKKPEKVVETFETAIQRLDNKVEGLMELGFYYQGKKEYIKAHETFLRCLKHNANAGGAIYQLGKTALLSGKNLKTGLSYLNKYLTYKPKPGEPEWADARWRRGLIFEKQGDVKQAVNEYKQALKLNEKHEAALKELKRLKK